MRDIVVTPFGRIVSGESKPLKNGKPGQRMLVGKIEDITDKAILAVLDHMCYNAKKTGYYQISCETGTLSFMVSASVTEATQETNQCT